MILGMLQNDASLLGCRLIDLRGMIDFSSEEVPDAIGAGYVENGQALVRRRPGKAAGIEPLDLLSDVKASGLIVHVRKATVGGFKDENTHPFRYRNWIFAHSGTVEKFGDLRPELIAELPSFLPRMIAGETDSEHIFAVFLHEMHKRNILETHQPPVDLLAEAALKTIEKIDALSRKVGGSKSTINFIATNGHCLTAGCHGNTGIWFRELGGLETCKSHGLDKSSTETHAEKIPHLNMRSLVVASNIKKGLEKDWSLLSPGQVMASGPDLNPIIFDQDATLPDASS